jgi:hypothetical protein
MKHLFIALSNNQIINHQQVIKQLDIASNQCVLVCAKELVYDQSLFDEVILIKGSLDNKAVGIKAQIRAINQKINNYKKAIKALDKYKYERKITLYYCYIEDVLTNFLLFSFNKNLKGIAVEDGVLNYYNHTLKSMSRLKYNVKYFITNLKGVRFKRYKGHSSGIAYDKVICQYVKLPQLSINPNKSRQLSYKKRAIDTLDNSVFILGQEPLENVIGSSLYYQKLDFLFNYINILIKENNIKNVYYKPHRNGRPVKKNYINKRIDNSKVTLLNDTEVAENIFFEAVKSKYVVGFNSSALINIKIQLEDRFIQDFEGVVFLEEKDPLQNLFRKLDFTIINN